MPSGTTEVLAAIPFAPTADTLEAAIASLDAADASLRREAFERYRETPPAGPRPGRGWKYDYAKLAFDDLRWTHGSVAMPAMPLRPVVRDDTAAEVDRPALATENAGGLYHLGATFVDAPSGADPRIVVRQLDPAAALDDDGTIVDWRDDAFAALSVAFRNCGAYVRIPAGVVLDAPIQLIWGSTPDTEAIFPRIVVVLEAGARATVIERFVGDGDPLVCGIVEAYVGDGAELDYVAVQQSGEDARLFITRSARCERGARIAWHLAELGGALARTVLNAKLNAPGAQADASALFFNTGMQHVDLTSGADHIVGHTLSDTVVRSAATDRGQGRYVGNIVIRPKAHGSDASLRDDALILGKHAHVDSVPALEIAANDVKAFHGATVGSLDEDAMFYVASRGIARPQALRLITLGFFEPVIARFPGEPLRDEIRTALDHKIDAATEIDR